MIIFDRTKWGFAKPRTWNNTFVLEKTNSCIRHDEGSCFVFSVALGLLKSIALSKPPKGNELNT